MSWLDKLSEVDKKRLQGEDLLAAGAFEQAKTLLEQANEILESFYQAHHQVLQRDLETACAKIVEKNMQLGDAHLAEGNLEMARECYQICLDLTRSPRERDEILIKLGQIDQKEVPSENLEKLGQKVADNPVSPEALYDFATELAMEGYLNEAIRYLEKLATLVPDDGDVYYRLGNALLDTKRLDEARAAYEKALDLKYEDQAEIFYRLGCVELEGPANYLEAKKHFKKGLEIRSDHVECLKRLARLYVLEDDLHGAVEHLEAAAKIDVEDPSVFVALGDLYARMGRLEKARENWSRAIEIAPDSEDAEDAQEKLDAAQLEEEARRERGEE
ncbi:MAG: tetratricopeptide repeat protein [Candidatus Riflebacteria bacterium]|nr:tetratricopeptide repeat protein [Candidatus Riflebacteria bacterium]